MKKNDDVYVLVLKWSDGYPFVVTAYGVCDQQKLSKVEANERDGSFDHVEVQLLKERDYKDALELYGDWCEAITYKK